MLERKSRLVGYTSADQVPDPLLYAIQDLYARWLANSSYAQQANSIYQRHRESLTDRLGETTGTVFEKLSKAAGKPLEAASGSVKTILDGLVRANQDLNTGGLQLPSLLMEQGRDLLQVVHTISERPLVLILDACGKSKDLATQTSLLATFIRGLDEWPNCHIFLASRADAAPAGWLREFASEYQYDVEIYGSVALTLLGIVFPVRHSHHAAAAETSNSLFTKRTSSLTWGLHVRQCPRRIIRITSKPLIVADAVFMV